MCDIVDITYFVQPSLQSPGVSLYSANINHSQYLTVYIVSRENKNSFKNSPIQLLHYIVEVTDEGRYLLISYNPKRRLNGPKRRPLILQICAILYLLVPILILWDDF